MKEGVLERDGKRWRLRFRRSLPHAPEKVWRALTEPEHLAAWFPAEMHGEREAGAALRFVFPKGEAEPSDGQMRIYDPPWVLEFSWQDEILRFELQPEGKGCALLFLDTFDELGKAARDGAGWHGCLDLLEYHLDGASPPWDPGQRWAVVHPGYVERFGPEASTIGPPESMSS